MPTTTYSMSCSSCCSACLSVCAEPGALLAFEISSDCTGVNDGELEQVGSTQVWEKNGSGTIGGAATMECIDGCYFWTQEISGCIDSGTDYISVLDIPATSVQASPFMAVFNFTTHEGRPITVTVTL